jgi:hypothetical protein
MPKLDDAIETVLTLAPADAEEVATKLTAAGISSAALHPASVLAAADFCGRAKPFIIAPSGARQIVTTGSGTGYLAVGSVAARQASAYGASNVHEVVAGLLDKDVALDDSEVRAILPTATQGVVFLDEDWFWIPSGKARRNRLRNVTRAMLSVASPLEVGLLREGLRRRYAFRGLTVVPPRGVLLSFYDQHPEFELVPEGAVRSGMVLDYREELGETERTFVEVLRSTTSGVLDRVSFQRACVARGINVNTFSVYTTYSPILDHLGTDLWALRGAPVDSAAVEALRSMNAERPREQRLLDWGWSAEGSLWVAARVPEDGKGGGVLGIPSAVRRYVQGRTFLATAEDGTDAGRVSVNEGGSSWGYGPFLRRMGADSGDVLRVDFFLEGETAVLKLGDADLLIS